MSGFNMGVTRLCEEGEKLALVLGRAVSWLHVHIDDAPIEQGDHSEVGATGIEGLPRPAADLILSTAAAM